MQNDPKPNPILRFFLGERIHPNGRTIHEILNLNQPRIVGSTGGVIQWLFPLTTPSRHVPSAPTLSESELQIFWTEPKVRELYMVGINRFLELFGIAIHGSSGAIEPDFNSKENWMYPSYHHFMPVTRILRSLKLLGFSEEFTTLRKLLLLCNERSGGKLDEATLDIWKRI
jgi:hypothetical protein